MHSVSERFLGAADAGVDVGGSAAEPQMLTREQGRGPLDDHAVSNDGA